MILFLIVLLQSMLAISQERTNLGAEGNQFILDRYQSYLKNSLHCEPSDPKARRVIISGFGPFSGSLKNFSSEVLYSWGQFMPPKKEQDVSSATLNLKIKNSNLQICLLSLSTQWDLAAAIIINEALAFQPDFILMTGVGGPSFVVLETIAGNNITDLSGFDGSGNPLKQTVPVENYVLPNGSTKEIALTWKPLDIYTEIEAVLNKTKYELAIDMPSKLVDDYICNNTRYVVTHAANNTTVTLAGGKIVLTPNFLKPPITGFIHLPNI
jgi:pyrrolidone-carboxylate peptidase